MDRQVGRVPFPRLGRTIAFGPEGPPRVGERGTPESTGSGHPWGRAGGRSHLRALQPHPRAAVLGRHLSAPTWGPPPLPPPGPSPASRPDTATHRAPRCPRAPAAAAADSHLRTEDKREGRLQPPPAWREGMRAVRGADPPRQRTGLQAAAMVVAGLRAPGETENARAAPASRRRSETQARGPGRPQGLRPGASQYPRPLSGSGGHALAANRARPRIEVQPRARAEGEL